MATEWVFGDYFYLWGKLKNKVYTMNPHKEEELKENI
jgi:hypothetical protein